ncbi:hypothetical protein GH714_013205 [Hevea brasiliensis]|uniref:GRF-type domain-containing protein n=1 Tax=Hevea brasiliensis TaxID=3981 RepID=A0A6A6L161_HEVBR|nr:hypothetical protein GH714_013205 [Hevea brasiliensis]
MSTSDNSYMGFFEAVDSESSHSDSEYSELSYHEDSEVRCSCGLPAKLRVSQTPRNPFRLFYNCPGSYNFQCGFFRWWDEPAPTGDRHTDEVNLIRNECARLQGRLDEIEQRHENDRSVWEREKSELMLKLSTVQTELDEIKERLRTVNESDLMPPLDNLLIADDEGDDVIEIHTI